MPKAKGYNFDMRLYLDDFESVLYQTRNNPITNPEPGILPSVMRAAKEGKSGCSVKLQDPPIPGKPQSKKTKRAPK